MQNSLPNLLIIAGTGQNSGKTTLACGLIKRHSLQHKIIAVKITPHRYPVLPGSIVIVNNEHLLICEDTDPSLPKDSTRMLKSGATHAFFIMCRDEFLSEAFSVLTNRLPANCMIICESGGLANFVEPGLLLMVTRNEHIQIKTSATELMAKADKVFNTDLESFVSIEQQLTIEKHTWKLKPITA